MMPNIQQYLLSLAAAAAPIASSVLKNPTGLPRKIASSTRQPHVHRPQRTLQSIAELRADALKSHKKREVHNARVILTLAEEFECVVNGAVDDAAKATTVFVRQERPSPLAGRRRCKWIEVSAGRFSLDYELPHSKHTSRISRR